MQFAEIIEVIDTRRCVRLQLCWKGNDFHVCASRQDLARLINAACRQHKIGFVVAAEGTQLCEHCRFRPAGIEFGDR